MANTAPIRNPRTATIHLFDVTLGHLGSPSVTKSFSHSATICPELSVSWRTGRRSRTTSPTQGGKTRFYLRLTNSSMAGCQPFCAASASSFSRPRLELLDPIPHCSPSLSVYLDVSGLEDTRRIRSYVASNHAFDTEGDDPGQLGHHHRARARTFCELSCARQLP